jgi:colicin import membrane protein
MKNEIIKIEAPELQVIEKSKADQIRNTFEPMAEMLTKFENAYNLVLNESKDGITKEVTIKAKRLRIDIGRVRIETEKIRKEQKEEYLRAGKAIDGVSNILKWAVTEKENKLKEIENYFEIQEQKRLEKLQNDRAEKLSKYVEDAHERDLSKFAEDEFEALYKMKKQEYEDRLAAEKKAEEERILKEKAEAEERERIRKENERLKAEAEEREKLAKIEAEKRRKEEEARKTKEEAERKAREEEARKAKEAYEAKLKAERDAREKIEREIEAKRIAEEEARKAKEALIEFELKKGDIEKINDLINDLNNLKSKYEFKSKENKKRYVQVGELLDKVIRFINN